MRVNTPSVFLDRSLLIVFSLFALTSTFQVPDRSNFGAVASILVLAIAIYHRHSPFDAALKWFYLWSGLYIVWLIVASQFGHPELHEGAQIGRELLLFLLVPTGIWVFSNDRARRPPLYAFALGIVILSLYSIGQLFWGWDFLRPGMLIEKAERWYHITGNQAFAVIFGVYYATAGIFLFAYGLISGKQKMDWGSKFFVVSGVLSMGVAVLSSERGPTLAIVLILVLLAALLRSRRALIGIGVALLIMIATGLQSGVFSRAWDLRNKELSMLHDRSRLFIWTYSLKVAANNPMFGVGHEHFDDEYAKVAPTNIPDITIQVHAHNDFLNAACESGFPTALALLGLWAIVVGHCFQAQRSPLLSTEERGLAMGALASSVCFFITSQFDIPFGHTTTRQLLMILWAAGLAMYVRSRNAGQSPHR